MQPLDCQYLERFLNGDQHAFEQLVLRYKDHLIYFIMRYVKDSTVAERLAQEVFAYLYLNGKKLSPERTVRSYLFQFARKRAKRYLRRNRNHVQLARNENVVRDKRKLEQRLFSDPQKAEVCAALSKLSKRRRTVVLLSQLEELNEVEIAQVLRCPRFYVHLAVRHRRSAGANGFARTLLVKRE